MQYIVLDLGWRGGGRLLISPSLPFLSGQWVGGGSEVQKWGAGKEGVRCFAVCASRRIEGKWERGETLAQSVPPAYSWIRQYTQ